jgi:hypothetical protein
MLLNRFFGGNFTRTQTAIQFNKAVAFRLTGIFFNRIGNHLVASE